MVATDEEEELEAKLRLKDTELGEGRRREVEAILAEIKNVLGDKPGCNFSAQHVIDTGEAKLIRSFHRHTICALHRDNRFDVK